MYTHSFYISVEKQISDVVRDYPTNDSYYIKQPKASNVLLYLT